MGNRERRVGMTKINKSKDAQAHLITKEMQIKERENLTSIHLAKINMSDCFKSGEVVEKQVFTHTTGKNVELYSHFER